MIKHILRILGLQPRDKAVMLVDKTVKKSFAEFDDKRVQFPAEENALFLSTNRAAVTSVANQQFYWVSRTPE